MGFDGGGGEVHGVAEEGVHGEDDVGGGFGPRRKAFDVGDGDGDEGDEVGVEVELVELGLGGGGEDEEDLVASLGEFVGDVKECGEVTHCKPWVHYDL